MAETMTKTELSAHEELADIDDRLAGLDQDLKLLDVEELNARRDVEKAVNGEDALKYQMLQEKLTTIESKLSFVRKQKHVLLKERAPILATVNQEDAAHYSNAQASLRAELTKQVASEKALLEVGLTRFIAKLAYSQGSFAGSVSLDRVFSDVKQAADPIISKYKREGIR